MGNKQLEIYWLLKCLDGGGAVWRVVDFTSYFATHVRGQGYGACRLLCLVPIAF